MTTKNKCPICNKKYITVDEKNRKYDREWDEREILAHKINHIESGKVKRVVATVMELSEEQQREALDFIELHLI